MSYTAASSSSVNLTEAPYLPPVSGGGTLDLSAGRVAKKRPPLAVSATFATADTELRLKRSQRSHHGMPETADARKATYATNRTSSALTANVATLWDGVTAHNARAKAYAFENGQALEGVSGPAVWSTPPARNDEPAPHEWDTQPARWTRTRHPHGLPPERHWSAEHDHRDTVLNWQAPLVAADKGGPLNLRSAPYVPPVGNAATFELVPQAILKQAEPPTRSVDAGANSPAWSLKDALEERTIHPWDRKPRLGTEVEFPSVIEPDPPGGELPDEPEIKRTYIIMNASSLLVLPSETPLEFKDLTISLDADSFSWSMGCTILSRASMDQIRPTSEGPAEVIATINGYEWRFVIERYSLDKRFAKETYSISGVSRVQLLAAPYAPKTTGRISSQTTVSQAMTEQLGFTGFSIARPIELSDYVIPADVWGWDQKTPIEVISELAESQGAIVIPSRDEDVLNIRHRYKLIGPWSYDTLPLESVDAVIADAMTISYTSQWEPQPEYDAVFVSGVTAGVAVDVIRQGTAGGKPAPDVFGDLNVDSQQCRERGLTEIAGGGNQEIVTIETQLPTSGAPGLIEPAMLIEYRDSVDGSNTWRGNVLSNSINVSKPGTGRVTQTVKIERHHY